MATVTCAKCGEAKEALASPPVGGELGQTIATRICQDCWNEWRETSARLINHYGLNLGLPEHRAELRRAMKEFLQLEPAADQATPPAS
jgi:Fe-S cluster biosynthesis and repair protein YggX